ncbi:ly6/PLAUR domain-containing protein 6-like [Solea solea]|uniref:ly6/PLAUR domain-containing protein 6-like n=1 Tax=Solea solea TaxID=90069 RepID=UPI00272A0E34|nr:ly6/PLAUR domain-containing protein 6-like [Solea solea]XP_058510789.1 ly6/PLAUR domain-containing protein 6-like [Solea solea]
MELWPAVAWLLLLIAILDLLKSCHSRDFTEQDVILLYPSSTPFPGGFKCFTCEDEQDNFECNRWAPDVYCPREAKYCYTRHIIDVKGVSLSVTKRCAALDDCLATGCSEMDHEGKKVCTACCEGNICNLPVPRNETDSIFSTRSPHSGSTERLSRSQTQTFSITIALLIILRGV